MTAHADTVPGTPPAEPAITRTVRRIFGVTSAAVGLTAILGIVLSTIDHRWVTIGFEVILLPAAVFGILIGLGRFREGLALAMLCVAGTVLTAAVLTEPSMRQLINGIIPSVKVRLTSSLAIDLIHLGFLRLALGAVLLACAPAVVLARNPAPSIRSLLKGLAFAVPAIAVAALWAIPFTRAAITGIHVAITGLLGLASLILLIALVSASAHLILRAFEIANSSTRPEA